MELYDIIFRPVPPNRHQKNMFEPRHGPTRSMFISLRHENPQISLPFLAIRAIRVSNDLYGSDIISAYEPAKGLMRPINLDNPPFPVDDEILEAHANFLVVAN